MSRLLTPRRGLYAIVDPEHCGTRGPLEVAREVLDGGAVVVQLRAKSYDDRALLGLASAIRELCRHEGVPFVLNDRADIARAVEADGVHVGQDDLPIAAVRGVVGANMVIGLSTHGLEEALRAEATGADYVGFGPVYPTRSKANAEPTVGLAQLREVVSRLSIPVTAIGGIGPSEVAEVAAAGATFWAAISALSGAVDVRAATRAMCGPA